MNHLKSLSGLKKSFLAVALTLTFVLGFIGQAGFSYKKIKHCFFEF